MNIKDLWEQGKKEEIAFWRGIISGADRRYHSNFLNRIRAEQPFTPWLIGLIRTSAPENSKILDIAAGPVTQLGWEYRGKRLDITAIDVLADEYNALLDEYGLKPPVRTGKGEAEQLAQIFPPNTFDLIHIRNALDHCYDPVKVVAGALAILKPGAVFVVQSNINEAKQEKYIGLHQWNVDAENGELIFWRPGDRIRLNERFSGAIEVELNVNRNDQFLKALIRKTGR